MSSIAAIPINDTTQFLVLYFQARNCQNWQWVGYKVYAKLIRYASGKRDSDEIRTLWQAVYAMGYFEKRKMGTKTEYRFHQIPGKK
jgi:IS1 family transposase